MKKTLFGLALSLILFTITIVNTYSQSNQGYILYKSEPQNIFPDKISDYQFQKLLTDQFGEKGYMVQKYYFKNDKYLSEFIIKDQKGYQVYNPVNKLIYTWQENVDTAYTLNSLKYSDEFIGITELDSKDTILGIPCKIILVKSKLGFMKIWYNSDYLKIDPIFAKGHLYGHAEQIVQKIRCQPLKIEQMGRLMHVIQTALEFKEVNVDDNVFKIPNFNTVIENPNN